MSTNKEKSYFRFHSFGFEKFAEDSLLKVRKQIYLNFFQKLKPSSTDLVLDVGVSAQDHPASNFFEQYYPWSHNLTALGLGDFKVLEKIYPGLSYIKGDGKHLPFPDKHFDWVFSHAVVEHVGNETDQISFVGELIRVAKKGIFVTSPNRLHPLEFHTGFPLFHYLPKRIHLWIYSLLGKKFYSSEENLNLLFPNTFRKVMMGALALAQIKNYKLEKQYVYWLGLPSNTLFLLTFNDDVH